MIRSTNMELGEYDLIRTPEHVAKVWEAVETALPKYWEQFVNNERQNDPASQLVANFGGGGGPKEGALVAPVFEKAVEAYEKAAGKYRDFFDSEAMEEYLEDPKEFKDGLARDVPVIASTLRQQHAELREWQMHFRSSRPNDLLTVFQNVLDFQNDWREAHPVTEYVHYDSPEDFELDPLDDDEGMFIPKVIGMGIKSYVLHYLDPQRFPMRGRNSLYGLYFLSGTSHFGLPSNSSEFLMVNDLAPVSDGIIIMDQNYWYPYGLFSLYALRIFRWIEQRGSSVGFAVDSTLRYVYVERFFQAVCDQHTEDLKTMRAHERFEVPM